MSRTPDQIAANWYQRSFEGLYPIVYAHRTVEAAGPEANFAAEQLDLKSRERLLDLCCGNGRHMVHLIRRTPEVTGLDYSPELLNHARALLGSSSELVRADMRMIPFGTVFDAVTNFFTSFGYFATDEENARVVREVARVLKPGGRFFIDYLNAVHVEKTLVPESVREYNEYRIEERRWIDAARRRVNKIMTVWRAGQRLGEWGESVRLYDERELRTLLAAERLQVDRVFGDYAGEPGSPDLPRMILVGHRG